MRQLIAANWKMHGDMRWASKPEALSVALSEGTREKTDIVICPPAHMIAILSAANPDDTIRIGAQNCHHAEQGAHTGEISAAMVSDAGADYVIVGHSERRADCAETNEDVALKAFAAYQAGLVVIICIGESLDQREAGEAMTVVSKQLLGSVPDGATSMNTVIAYEPIWAIGTGKVPSLGDIEAMHDHIRSELSARFGASTADNINILYGGSVKPGNASGILAIGNVDGALVGGASLDMESFAKIADCADDGRSLKL